MIISAPCIITARLLPGLRLPDGGTISIDYADRAGDETRVRYRYYIDLPDSTEYSADDLQSGNIRGEGLQSGLASLLAFLGASAESFAYDIRRGGNGMGGENSELFPRPVVEWASQNADEISMLAYELEEGEDIISE